MTNTANTFDPIRLFSSYPDYICEAISLYYPLPIEWLRKYRDILKWGGIVNKEVHINHPDFSMSTTEDEYLPGIAFNTAIDWNAETRALVLANLATGVSDFSLNYCLWGTHSLEEEDSLAPSNRLLSLASFVKKCPLKREDVITSYAESKYERYSMYSIPDRYDPNDDFFTLSKSDHLIKFREQVLECNAPSITDNLSYRNLVVLFKSDDLPNLLWNEDLWSLTLSHILTPQITEELLDLFFHKHNAQQRFSIESNAVSQDLEPDQDAPGYLHASDFNFYEPYFVPMAALQYHIDPTSEESRDGWESYDEERDCNHYPTQDEISELEKAYGSDDADWEKDCYDYDNMPSFEEMKAMQAADREAFARDYAEECQLEDEMEEESRHAQREEMMEWSDYAASCSAARETGSFYNDEIYYDRGDWLQRERDEAIEENDANNLELEMTSLDYLARKSDQNFWFAQFAEIEGVASDVIDDLISICGNCSLCKKEERIVLSLNQFKEVCNGDFRKISVWGREFLISGMCQECHSEKFPIKAKEKNIDPESDDSWLCIIE